MKIKNRGQYPAKVTAPRKEIESMDNTNMNCELLSSEEGNRGMFNDYYVSPYLTSGNDVLVIRVDLACAIGLNEAILLNQIHYWVQKSQNEQHLKNGKYWIWKTYNEWHNEIPFLSVRTLKRTMTSLKNKGLIEVSNFNKKNWDRTMWYTINYGKIDEILLKMRECQNGTLESDNLTPSMVTKWHDQYQRLHTETTTKTTNKNEWSDSAEDGKQGDAVTSSADDMFAKIKDGEWSDFDEAKMHSPVYGLKVRLYHLYGCYDSCMAETERAIMFFFERYEYLKGKPHEYIVYDDKFYKPTEYVKTLVDCLGYEPVKDIINQYFNVIPKDCWDYRHFGTHKILEHRMYELGYGQSDVKAILEEVA